MESLLSLNIKNEETCRLVEELAHLTGESKTGAITVAIRQRLARERRALSVESRSHELSAIGQRCSSLLRDGPSATDHGDYLYGDSGLPE